MPAAQKLEVRMWGLLRKCSRIPLRTGLSPRGGMGRRLDMSTSPGTHEATPSTPHLPSSDSRRHPVSGVTCYSCENNTGRTEAYNRRQNARAHIELTADPREAGSDRPHAAGCGGGNARTSNTGWHIVHLKCPSLEAGTANYAQTFSVFSSLRWFLWLLIGVTQ